MPDPAAPEGPPLLKARQLLILFRTDDGEPRGWPRRNVLLLTFPGGDRWAAELASGHEGSARAGEPLAFARLATASRAFELWRAGEAADASAPCGGERWIVRSGERELAFFAGDVATRSVKAEIRELRETGFSEEERREVALLHRLRVPEGPGSLRLLGAAPAWELLSLDRARPASEQRDLALMPDPDPPGELEPWGSLTHLPSPLPSMGLPDGLP